MNLVDVSKRRLRPSKVSDMKFNTEVLCPNLVMDGNQSG